MSPRAGRRRTRGTGSTAAADGDAGDGDVGDGNASGGDAGEETDAVRCPFCGSTDPVLDQRKGSAICRVLYHCPDCQQPFELFA